MKKLKGLLIVVLTLVLLTGCSSSVNLGSITETPEGVALEMAKRMSKGEYGNIRELLKVEDDTYVDNEAFVSYLDSEGLNIKGNEKYSVSVYSTEEEREYDYYKVKVNIDDNKILNVETVKVDGKWLIDLGYSAFEDNLEIDVPVGAKVTLNSQVLDSSLAKTESVKKTFKGNKSYTATVDYDKYIIPELLKGNYNLKIEMADGKTVNEVINSDFYDYFSGMYDEDKRLFISGYSYNLFMHATDEVNTAVINQVKSLYKDIIENNGPEFSTISKYFNSSFLTEAETYYNKNTKGFVDTTYSSWTETFTNVKIEWTKDGDDRTFIVGKDHFVVQLAYKMSYTSNKDYSSSYFTDTTNEEEFEKEIVVDVIKDASGNYVINGGTLVLPSFSSYS